MEGEANPAAEQAAEVVQPAAPAQPEPHAAPAPVAPQPSSFDRVADAIPELRIDQAKAVASVLGANPGLSPQQALLLVKAEKPEMFPASKPSNVNINPNSMNGSPAPAGSAPAPRPAPKSDREIAAEKQDSFRNQLLAMRSGNDDRRQVAAAWHYARRQAGFVPANGSR